MFTCVCALPWELDSWGAGVACYQQAGGFDVMTSVSQACSSKKKQKTVALQPFIFIKAQSVSYFLTEIKMKQNLWGMISQI